VGVTGINSVPFRARSIEQRLRGLMPASSVLQELCADVPEADPLSDLHADADYRRQLLKFHAARALMRALDRARAQCSLPRRSFQRAVSLAACLPQMYPKVIPMPIPP